MIDATYVAQNGRNTASLDSDSKPAGKPAAQTFDRGNIDAMIHEYDSIGNVSAQSIADRQRRPVEESKINIPTQAVTENDVSHVNESTEDILLGKPKNRTPVAPGKSRPTANSIPSKGGRVKVVNGTALSSAPNRSGLDDATELPDSGGQARNTGMSNKIVPTDSDTTKGNNGRGGAAGSPKAGKRVDYITKLLEQNKEGKMSLRQENELKMKQYEIAKQRLQDDYIKSWLQRKTTIVKPFAEMTPDEKKQRIRRLWTKVRLYVRIRSSLGRVQDDIDRKFYNKMINQSGDDDDDDGAQEYNSDDDEQDVERLELPWY